MAIDLSFVTISALECQLMCQMDNNPLRRYGITRQSTR
jgi:hypothetical protein